MISEGFAQQSKQNDQITTENVHVTAPSRALETPDDQAYFPAEDRVSIDLISDRKQQMTYCSSKVQLLKMSANCSQATVQKRSQTNQSIKSNGNASRVWQNSLNLGSKHTVWEESTKALFGTNSIAATKPEENV